MWLKMFSKKRQPPVEVPYKKTLRSPAEAKAFIKSLELVTRERLTIERGAHGGGCPYPSRMLRRHWYNNGFFDWL